MRQGNWVERPSTIIAPMRADQRSQFGAIWLPWLETTMRLEPQAEDLLAMADPIGYFAARGGGVLLANRDDEVVGAIALTGLGDDGFEFCKLVVRPEARGIGLGRALVEACLAYAHNRGALWLYLQSFHRLGNALRMYGTMGFIDAPAPAAMDVLARTEVIMRRRTER